MKKFIPYEKLSKKEKRKVDAAARNTWGDLNPVTRKPVSSRAYQRSKSRNWRDDQFRDFDLAASLIDIARMCRVSLPALS